MMSDTVSPARSRFILCAKNLDEAIAIAVKILMARKGTVEIRPVIEIPGLPDK